MVVVVVVTYLLLVVGVVVPWYGLLVSQLPLVAAEVWLGLL